MIPNQDLVFLGLDIGWVHTRAMLFGVLRGRYRLLGQGVAQTTLGAGQHLGRGVGGAIEALEKNCSRKLLNKNGAPILPVRADGSGMDRIALAISVGPALRTVVTGLADTHSLRAGRALLDSLPLEPVGGFSLSAFKDESALVDQLVSLRPELIVMAGGETGGSVRPLKRWIEVVRRVVRLLDEPDRPSVLYAGNPALWDLARRRLEHFAPLYITANIQPESNRYDLLPAQSVINRLIVRQWIEVVSGLKDLAALAENQVICGSFGVNRMMRFLSRPVSPIGEAAPTRGVIAVDLGAGSATLAVGVDGHCLCANQSASRDSFQTSQANKIDAIYHWMSEDLERSDVSNFYYRRMLHPGWVPATSMELAFEQAFARYRLQAAVMKMSEDYAAASYDLQEGWQGHFEPIIASGEVFDRSPLPGQVVLMLLDGLQPRGVTTLVNDKYQILPLLGLLGEQYPLLPIHLLETDAFQNLGTVITATSPLPEGEKVLTLQVIKESGADFQVDVQQGALRRILIQVDEPVVLVLKPEQETDVGFGEPGLGGRLKVAGGTLGVVVDARGRPLPVPVDPSERVAQLQRWSRTLGAGE